MNDKRKLNYILIAVGCLPLLLAAGCATTPTFVLPSESGGAVPTVDLNEAAANIDRVADHYRFGESRKPLAAVEVNVQQASQSPADRRAVAALLANGLEASQTWESKQFFCRELALVGTEAEVPAIAALLPDEGLSDAARYALERIPGDAVDAALIGALDETSGNLRVGMINSLGVRRSASAKEALRALRNDPDPTTAEAARAALKRIGR